MKTTLFVSLAALTLSASAATIPLKTKPLWSAICGTTNPPRSLDLFPVETNATITRPRIKADYLIPTYIWVVNKEDQPGRNLELVDENFRVLNQGFQGTGFQFELVQVEEVTNDTWAIGATDEINREMKAAKRQGDYATLNIFYQSDQQRFGGEATFPEDLSQKPEAFDYDGIMVAANTMPGYDNNPDNPYNAGDTTVHEAGHWMNLYHVFEDFLGDPCTTDGDLVADTPFQRTSTDYVCPEDNTKHSCPFIENDPGYDSIHNFMDYSNDLCRFEFTYDQVGRMVDEFNKYRYGKDRPVV